MASTRRYFTVDEANAQLGRVSALFEQVLQLRAQIKTISTRFDRENASERDVATINALVEAAGEVVQEISSSGCVIKDLSQGLVDWPAIYHGREVWLCWRYGEAEVGHWHDMNAGFAGRRPIAELGAGSAHQLH